VTERQQRVIRSRFAEGYAGQDGGPGITKMAAELKNQKVRPTL